MQPVIWRVSYSNKVKRHPFDQVAFVKGNGVVPGDVVVKGKSAIRSGRPLGRSGLLHLEYTTLTPHFQ